MARTRLWGVAVAIAFACVAALLFTGRKLADRSLDTILSSGTIRIGYAVEAPHAFLDPGGEVTGQSPEVAKRVARLMGARVIEWRLAEFGALLAELEEGRIDVVAAGMFITPERARRVAFSEPIFHVQQGLLVARGNPLSLHSYKDVLDRPKARLAVLSGAVEHALAERMGVPRDRIVPVPDAQAGLAAVETREADALALSSPTITWMASRQQLGRTEMARPFLQPDPALTGKSGYGAFAFRKADRALLKAWNEAQAEFLAGPEYRLIMTKFGFSPGEYPGDASAREVAGQ